MSRYTTQGGRSCSPTLFLASEHDHLVPAVEQAMYMAERVSDSHVEVLHGHGHICFIAPDLDLARLLRDWRVRRRAQVGARGRRSA